MLFHNAMQSAMVRAACIGLCFLLDRRRAVCHIRYQLYDSDRICFGLVGKLSAAKKGKQGVPARASCHMPYAEFRIAAVFQIQ